MRTLVVLLFAVLLLVLQSALHTLVPLRIPVPAFALLAPLYLALSPRWSVPRAVVCAFIVGYVFDLVSGARVGVHALAIPLVVLIGTLLGSRLSVRGPFARAVTCFLLTLVFGVFILGTSRMAGTPGMSGARSLLLEAALTAAFGPPVFAVLDRVERRFDPSAVRLNRPSRDRYDTGIELRR
jgi:rod shape-determining protein MreD